LTEGEGPEVYRLAQSFSTAAAASLVERALGRTVAGIDRDTVAGSHAVFFVRLEEGFECVLRVATAAHQSVERERWVIEQCRARGVPAPEIIAGQASPADGALPYLIARRMPGVPAHTVALSDSERRSVLGQLAEAAARMHSIPLAGFGPLVKRGSTYVGTGGSLGDEVLWRLPDLPAEALALNRALAVRERFASEREALNRRQGALVHADFRFENALLEGARVSAILDFELACSGDPAIDLASLLYCNGRDDADLPVILDGYGRLDLLAPEETLMKRLLLYQSFYALEHLFWEHAFQDEAGMERTRERLLRLQEALDRS
jgi:aminoglycoside phosphotransferase (APT) family kinase protein